MYVFANDFSIMHCIKCRERDIPTFPGRLDMLHCEPRSALQILNVWNLMRLMAHVRISGADGYLAKDVGYLG